MPKKALKNEFKIELSNIIAIFVVIALAILAVWGLSKYQTPVEPTVSAAQSVSYDCAEGQTALAVLQEKAETKTQDSEYGVYVDEINGTANNDGGFWIYYVNGDMGQVGADQYACKTGDKIEWRFEELF